MVPTCSMARCGVLHVGKPDGDLVAARALDLGLGDAERVGALADRVDRVVHRLRRDLRHLRRGPALVDELDAAAAGRGRASWASWRSRSRARQPRAAPPRSRGSRGCGCGWSSGSEHQEQAAVVVVGGEDVRLRGLGAVALGVHGHRLVEHPHAPFEGGADVVVAAAELESRAPPCTGRPITSRSPRPVSSRAPRPVPISRPAGRG